MSQPITTPSPLPQAATARNLPRNLVRGLPRPVGGDPNHALQERIKVAA